MKRRVAFYMQGGHVVERGAIPDDETWSEVMRVIGKNEAFWLTFGDEDGNFTAIRVADIVSYKVEIEP